MPQLKNSRRIASRSGMVEKITGSITNTYIFRTWGIPAAGVSASAREINVPIRKRPSGIHTRGSRNFSPESSRAASASPSRICDTAMENRIETAEPNAT